MTSVDGEIEVSVIRRKDSTAPRPCIYWMHGGGVIIGSRYFQLDEFALFDWVAEFDIVLVTPEYRLAPEFPDPTPIEDCYAGLAWAFDEAGTLGIDTDAMIVGGPSGGGCLAAGLALLARDRGKVPLAGQILVCPMLDHRNDTVSSNQYSAANGNGAMCSQEVIDFMWEQILGPNNKNRDVSPYASASRAEDLGGLPPAYVDAGSAEAFRDEAVQYALRLWEAGVQAELHIWEGGFHGFDVLFPDVDVSIASRAARQAWLARTVARLS